MAWMAAACLLLGFFSSCIGSTNAAELTCGYDNGGFINGDSYSIAYFNALVPGNNFTVTSNAYGYLVESVTCAAAPPAINDFIKLLSGDGSAPALQCGTGNGLMFDGSAAGCTTGVGVLNGANGAGVLDNILATVGVPAKAYAGKTFLEKLTVLTTSSEFADYSLKLARENLAQLFAPTTVIEKVTYADDLMRSWKPSATNLVFQNEIFRQLVAVGKNISNITAELVSSVSTINNDLAKKATVTAVDAKANKSYVDTKLATKVSADQLAAMQSTIDDLKTKLVIMSSVLGALAAVGIGIGIYSISFHKQNPQTRKYEKLPVLSAAVNDNSGLNTRTGNINNAPTYE